MIRQLITAPFALALAAAPAAASDEGWDDAGTVVEIALVATALGAPAVQGDWEGALQAGGSVGAAVLVTQGLKAAFPVERPDGSGDASFPSQHASASFAAAATIHNRHGWEVGLPAQLAAAFVAYSRVEARRHRVEDVLVGAAIGQAAGFLITSRRDSRVQIFPWGDTESAGLTMAMRF